MLTRYDANFEDIVFELTEEEKRAIAEAIAGGGGAAAKDRPFAGTSPELLVSAMRNGQVLNGEKVTEAKVIAELKAQGMNDQAINSAIGKGPEPGKITPPSLPGAGLAEMVVEGKTGAWYVRNQAGETVSGPYRTKDEATDYKKDFIEGRIPAAEAPAAAGSSSSRATAGGAGTGSGGGASSPAAQAAAPIVNPNSRQGLIERGGLEAPGNRIVRNGQQYGNLNKGTVQLEDGYHIVGPDGNPMPQAFKTQTAATAAMELTGLGPAIRSRLGNSPTAKAAGQGGFSRTVDNPLFDLIPLDQSIVDTATRGAQKGDILGTSVRAGYPSLDITRGGISEGGGLTLVGNAESFTGQLPGDVSIGESSILMGGTMDSNYGRGPLHWLQQATGIPQADLAKFIKTPDQAMQFQQAVDTARANGMLPNFASLYATNEPYSNVTKAGDPRLESGGSNTPYDKALSGFAEYAVGSPDLELLPNPDPTMTVLPENWWIPQFGNGGRFMTDGRLDMVDHDTGELLGVAGEVPGQDEEVRITPMSRVATGGMMGGRKLGAGGKPTMFAKGGTIRTAADNPYDISKMRDENGQVTELGRSLGYSDQPFEGGGPTYIPRNGVSGDIVNLPRSSKSGLPVVPQFVNMSPTEQERFINQGGRAGTNAAISGPIGPAPIGTDPRSGLPIYEQLNPKDYSILGEPDGYDFVPMNNAGTPILVRVPRYNTVPGQNADQRKANQVAYLTGLLSNNGVYQGGPGYRGEYGNLNSREATLAALYDVDPKTALLYASQGQGGRHQPPWGQEGGGFGGMMGGRRRDLEIENEARRRRMYDIQASNYRAAGLPPPTILGLDVNTQGVDGGQSAGGGSSSGGGGGFGNPDRQGTDYYPFSRNVPNGFTLPFDYEPGNAFYNRDGNDGYYGRRGSGRPGDWRNNFRGGMMGGRRRGRGRTPWGPPLMAGAA